RQRTRTPGAPHCTDRPPHLDPKRSPQAAEILTDRRSIRRSLSASVRERPSVCRSGGRLAWTTVVRAVPPNLSPLPLPGLYCPHCGSSDVQVVKVDDALRTVQIECAACHRAAWLGFPPIR